MMIEPDSFLGLPGGDLVNTGLQDLSQGIVSQHSLLLMIASPRLRRLGIVFQDLEVDKPYEHSLYSLLEDTHGEGAFSYYNSLTRRIVSFAHCLEREQQAKSNK